MNKKYILSFEDILLDRWTVEFFADYNGDVKEMIGRRAPVQISFEGDDDIYEERVMTSRATVSVMCQEDGEYQDLQNIENFEVKVIIKCNDVLFWQGYVLPHSFLEPFIQPPYQLDIVCSDVLGLLNQIQFNELNFSGREKLSEIFYAIFENVGITEYDEYINYTHTDLNYSPGDSIFKLSGADTDLLNPENCYDALEILLKGLNAHIRQDTDGRIKIFRVPDFATQNILGRRYSSKISTVQVSIDPVQKINRANTPSGLHEHGGTVGSIPNYEKVIINLNYNFKGSILDNYDFAYDNFTFGDEDKFYWLQEIQAKGWTKNNSFFTITPMFGEWMESNINKMFSYTGGRYEADPKGGVVFGEPTENYNMNYYLEQIVYNIRETTDLLKVEWDFYIKNTHQDMIDTPTTIYCKIINTDGTDSLEYNASYEDALTTWEEYSAWLAKNVVSSFDGMSDNKVTLNTFGIPFSGELKVRLHEGFLKYTKAGTSSLRIYFINKLGDVPEGKSFYQTGLGGVGIKEIDIDFGDGYGFDNDHLQYAGAINLFDNNKPYPAHKTGNTYLVGWKDMSLRPDIGGELTPIAYYGYRLQFVRPRYMIDLNLRERNKNEHLNLVGALEDELKKYNNVVCRFAIGRSNFDVFNRDWEVNISEVL